MLCRSSEMRSQKDLAPLSGKYGRIARRGVDTKAGRCAAIRVMTVAPYQDDLFVVTKEQLGRITSCVATRRQESFMGFGRGALLWLLGVPLPIILLLAIFMNH
jgi:hypothetical protein